MSVSSIPPTITMPVHTIPEQQSSTTKINESKINNSNDANIVVGIPNQNKIDMMEISINDTKTTFDNHENGNNVIKEKIDLITPKENPSDFIDRMINKNQVTHIKTQIIQWESLINDHNKEIIELKLMNLRHKLNATLESAIGNALDTNA